MTDLLNHRLNIYSQNGEDGVLAEVLRRLAIPKSRRWCVEFGAWDGVYLSNTFNLVKNQGWKAVYIEGDIGKFPALLKTAEENSGIIPVQAMVIPDHTDHNSLDNLLKTHAARIPVDYGFLSIDIDGHDLAVWETHKEYRPWVVCIEINSGIPVGVMERHGERGNSFSSTLEYAQKNEYTLVCHTGNMIFVANEKLKDKFNDLDLGNPNNMFIPDWL